MKKGTHHDPATRVAIAATIARKQAYRQASAAARALIYQNGSVSVDVKLAAIDDALRFAPDELKPTWVRYRDAIAAGRRLKLSSHPVTFVMPVDQQLIDEVEAALAPDPETEG